MTERLARWLREAFAPATACTNPNSPPPGPPPLVQTRPHPTRAGTIDRDKLEEAAIHAYELFLIATQLQVAMEHDVRRGAHSLSAATLASVSTEMSHLAAKVLHRIHHAGIAVPIGPEVSDGVWKDPPKKSAGTSPDSAGQERPGDSA